MKWELSRALGSLGWQSKHAEKFPDELFSTVWVLGVDLESLVTHNNGLL